jgi:hypothetical protein
MSLPYLTYQLVELKDGVPVEIGFGRCLAGVRAGDSITLVSGKRYTVLDREGARLTVALKEDK